MTGDTSDVRVEPPIHPQSSRKLVIVLAIFAVICVVVIVQITIAAVRYAERAKSEYGSVAVFAAVTQYADTHEGRWPTSWSDLDLPADLQDRVRIRFDVTAQNLIDQPYLLESAIEPTVGNYHIFPHVVELRKNLLDRLRALNPNKKS